MVLLAGCSSSNADGPTTRPTTATTSIPATAPPTTGRVTGSIRPADIVVVDPAQPGDAAADLSSVTRCGDDDPAQPIADLTWAPASIPGGAQRVEVSIDPRGFGESAVIGPTLPGDARSTRWTEIAGQAVHLWRVLTEQDGTWVSSPVASFEGPTCAVDHQPGLRRLLRSLDA